MKIPCGFLATSFLFLIATSRVGAQKTPCLSKVRGVVFPSPTAYPVPAEATHFRHPPILATSYDRLYRTLIREAAKSKPNFAGHFVITSWGCGSGCSQLAIVDLRNGKVYDPQFANVTYHYPQTLKRPDWDCFDDVPRFSVASRLLVVEGCLNESNVCGRHFYSMEPAGLHEIMYDPDIPADSKVAP